MSGRVTFRPATAEDIAIAVARHGGDMAENPSTVPTIIAWVGEVATDQGPQAVGIGGFAVVNGHYRAFVDITPEGRAYKKDIVRAGRFAMGEARRLGLRHVYAEADESVAAGAVRWLQRLGFKPDERSAGRFWRWQ